jgi:two-component system chemotaxis sensor kinase CheA
MSDPVDLREFVAGFLVEAEEHLRFAKPHLLAADEAARRGEASPRAVRELFRSLHTMKGLAAMIGVEPIVDIAHGMEAVLRAADRGSGKLSPGAVEHLIAGSAAIELRVRALADHEAVPPAPPRLLAALADLEAGGASRGLPVRGALTLAPELDAKLTPSEREQLGAGIARGDRALRADFAPSPARA